MNNRERYDYFNSGDLQRKTAIELLDWAGYWTTAGLDEITDPLQREQTRQAIRMILTNLSGTNKIVSHLAISYDAIKEAEVGHVTDAMVRGIVTNIMAFKLEWITGLRELPEPEPEPEPEE